MEFNVKLTKKPLVVRRVDGGRNNCEEFTVVNCKVEEAEFMPVINDFGDSVNKVYVVTPADEGVLIHTLKDGRHKKLDFAVGKEDVTIVYSFITTKKFAEDTKLSKDLDFIFQAVSLGLDFGKKNDLVYDVIEELEKLSLEKDKDVAEENIDTDN